MDSMGAAAKEAADEVEVRAAASGYSNGPRRPLPVRIADFCFPSQEEGLLVWRWALSDSL